MHNVSIRLFKFLQLSLYTITIHLLFKRYISHSSSRLDLVPLRKAWQKCPKKASDKKLGYCWQTAWRV